MCGVVWCGVVCRHPILVVKIGYLVPDLERMCAVNLMAISPGAVYVHGKKAVKLKSSVIIVIIVISWVSGVSSGLVHVLRAHMGRTCGEPNGIDKAAIDVELTAPLTPHPRCALRARYADVATMPYKRIRRPIYPLDKDMAWTPAVAC